MRNAEAGPFELPGTRQLAAILARSLAERGCFPNTPDPGRSHPSSAGRDEVLVPRAAQLLHHHGEDRWLHGCGYNTSGPALVRFDGEEFQRLPSVQIRVRKLVAVTPQATVAARVAATITLNPISCIVEHFTKDFLLF